jgi:hypothetical protein
VKTARFTTETGTIYEFRRGQDGDGLLRVVAQAFTGRPAPERPGTGEWRDFEDMLGPAYGLCALICWRTTPEGVSQCTRTSPVVHIEDVYTE